MLGLTAFKRLCQCFTDLSVEGFEFQHGQQGCNRLGLFGHINWKIFGKDGVGAREPVEDVYKCSENIR